MEQSFDPAIDSSGAELCRSAYHAAFSTEDFERYIVFQGSGGNIVADMSFSATGSIFYLDQLSPDDRLFEALEKIEHAFGLNKVELAKVCKTTRKTIYNWLRAESEPQKKNFGRIFDLLVVANDWLDAGFPTDRKSLNQPIVDGRSVFDLLCDAKLDRSLIQFAGSRLRLSGASATPIIDPFA
jgi:hypothetical protein